LQELSFWFIKAFYYDSAKFDTYPDQQGIKYPTPK